MCTLHILVYFKIKLNELDMQYKKLRKGQNILKINIKNQWDFKKNLKCRLPITSKKCPNKIDKTMASMKQGKIQKEKCINSMQNISISVLDIGQELLL